MEPTALFLQSTPVIFEAPVTLALLIVTIITSYQAMNNYELKYKLIFNAVDIQQKKEWYRFWSHGLIHADWIHLAVNMFVLYEFGHVVEMIFNGGYKGLAMTSHGVFPIPNYMNVNTFYNFDFGIMGSLFYLLLYGLGLAAASLYSFFKHRHNYGYSALGASGAVSGIVFAYILFLPTQLLYLFGIVPMPAIVMGVAYLIYSHVMAKRGRDNVGHDAHFWGAVWGFVFTAALRPSLLINFWYQITTPEAWFWG